MSADQQQQYGEEERDDDDNSNKPQQQQQEEWAAMAKAWLLAFPEARDVSTAEVEAWIDSTSLPTELRHMPRSLLVTQFLSINTMLRPHQQQPQHNHHEKVVEEEDDEAAAESPEAGFRSARFQRTDQWRPVYEWLESLDRKEVVKSKDISDWLNVNPSIREELTSRHSRYHLMHYIKKCHVKILKRKQKKKGLQEADQATSPNIQGTSGTKPPPQSPSKLINIPKDSDLYVLKRNEALQKFQILVELEKHLGNLFPNQQVEGI